jgi:diguanylate cyclase (GGDEF)-like protein
MPKWFIKLVPLEAPEANSYVTYGWKQAGTIYVKSHPGYAYNALWNDIIRTTLLFTVCGILILIIGSCGLHLLLRPLVRVEQQADALCRREYDIQGKLPRTRELRRVVQAMNRMTEKVKEMFGEQVLQAEGLRKHAYNDPLTGVGNRRYFESQVSASLDKESIAKGILLLVRVHDLEKINAQKGFLVADEFLKSVAACINEITEGLVGSILARLSGSDFAVFLPDYPSSDAEIIASKVSDKLSTLAASDLTSSERICNIGVCAYDHPITLAHILSEADMALGAAMQIGPNTFDIRIIAEDTKKAPLGQRQWKETLEKALKEHHLLLYAQPVVRAADKESILHMELFSRILLEDGEIINAGLFMPLAERLKLVSSLDRMVIEDVLDLDPNLISTDSIALNISPSSLHDKSFIEWLHRQLKNMPAKAPKISFEFTEIGAVQNEKLVKEFTTLVREYGHGMGLDHYGQSYGNLRYLQSLRPDYVKIDRGYTGELKDKDSDSRFFISSICSVAHSIDVVVIAEGVETENQWQTLRELNIDAVQGYIIERPKEITRK